jgi:ankyrin repeat protein
MRFVLLLGLLSITVAASEIQNAVKEKDLEKVKKLIAADPSSAVESDGDHVTPLHVAAELGLRDIVKVLIDNKAKVSARSLSLETPLHRACVNGNKDVVKMLLENNAELEVQARYGGTPLHNAAEKGHKHAVELLIQHKANVNAINAAKKTPLDLAAEKGYTKVVEILQKNGGKTASEVKIKPE